MIYRLKLMYVLISFLCHKKRTLKNEIIFALLFLTFYISIFTTHNTPVAYELFFTLQQFPTASSK